MEAVDRARGPSTEAYQQAIRRALERDILGRYQKTRIQILEAALKGSARRLKVYEENQEQIPIDSRAPKSTVPIQFSATV